MVEQLIGYPLKSNAVSWPKMKTSQNTVWKNIYLSKVFTEAKKRLLEKLNLSLGYELLRYFLKSQIVKSVSEFEKATLFIFSTLEQAI